MAYSIQTDNVHNFNRIAVQTCDCNAILQSLGQYFQGKKCQLHHIMCDADWIAKYMYHSENDWRRPDPDMFKNDTLKDVIIGWKENWSNGVFITENKMRENKIPLIETYDEDLKWIICRRTDKTQYCGINCEWVEISRTQARALVKRYFPHSIFA